MTPAGEDFASEKIKVRRCDANSGLGRTLHGLPACLQESLAQYLCACKQDIYNDLWRRLKGNERLFEQWEGIHTIFEGGMERRASLTEQKSVRGGTRDRLQILTSFLTTTMSPSKRKDALNNVASQPPAKRMKEDHHSDGEFQVVRAALTLSVPPVFAANPRAGIEEMLDSMIMR